MHKTMKRVLGLVLVLVMVLSMMPMTALAADPINFPNNQNSSTQADGTTAYYIYGDNYYKVDFHDLRDYANVNLYIDYFDNASLKLGGDAGRSLYTKANTDKSYNRANTGNLPGFGSTLDLYLRKSNSVAVTITRVSACEVLGHDWSNNNGICARYGCGHTCTHSFNDATCTAPSTCSICGKTEGNTLPHEFGAATCTTPSTCMNCPATEGDTLPHEFGAATCTTPSTCMNCPATEGDTLPHEFGAATCTTPSTCMNCPATEGDTLPHEFGAATCTTPSTCMNCPATEGEALDHDFNPATCTAPKTCKNCPATEGEALPHDFEDATCTVPSTCNNCGATEGEALGHICSYEVSSENPAQIVESCANGCGHSATATLVYAEGNGTYEYTGNDIEPLKVVYSENWNGDELSIEYSNNKDISKSEGEAYGKISIDNEVTVQTYYWRPPFPFYPPYNPNPNPNPTPTPTPTPEINTVEAELHFTIVKANQSAPVVAGVDETIDGKADGQITGVDATMEYRKAAEAELMLLSENEYTAISGTELTGLEDGTYFVRYKGDDYTNPSPETQITIKAGRKLTVTVPETQVGYTLTTDATELVWLGDANITFALAEGYSKTEAFAVKVNGTAVELDADDKYAIVDAKEDIVVTVEGVADITAPTAEVAISTNKWNTFLSTIDFAIFYKDAQSVTVTAADVNLDKVYYYVANAAMAEADVQAITEWTEYTAAFNIDPSNEYVVYVKAVDKSGNTAYVSSNGVVIDAIAPEITGVTNKGTYYYNTQFGASDKYLDTVTVDGKTVELKDGKYTIVADGKEHTIVATDKAGNSTTVKITVISTANAVPTGDDSNLWLWVVVLFMSAVGLTGTIAYDRKKKSVK